MVQRTIQINSIVGPTFVELTDLWYKHDIIDVEDKWTEMAQFYSRKEQMEVT